MTALRLYLEPYFTGEDQADGGIRRVVDAQRKHLPSYGIEIVDSIEEADVAAAHITPMATTMRWLRTHPEFPFVVHLHGAYFQGEYDQADWAEWALKANEQLLEAVRQADAITCPSEWVSQAFRRNSLRHVTTIGHGVELSEWPAANLQHHTGFALYNKTREDPTCRSDAVVTLAKMSPDVHFMTTFGDASLTNMSVTGPIPYEEAKELVREASVYLCTTRETFGIGTLEAMAAGIPVLGWRWGGQADIIEHKVTGWLSRPGDYDDLLAGLRWCLENQEVAGKAARAAVKERYRWKDVVKQYVDLYERVLADKPRAHKGKPKVSVIVTAYELAQYLPQTLESIADQTMTDWECIIVDDASPDACGKLADAAAQLDPRFRVIHNESNLGQTESLNTGMRAAQGTYLIAVDADNTITPDTLNLLSNALDDDRSLHIAYGNVLFVDEAGAPDKGVGPGGHSGWPMAFRPDWQLRPGSNLVPSTAMIRREVFELTGGYRRRYKHGEDADLWTRATSYGFRARMVTEADTLIYRNRPDSLSRTEPKANWSAWYPWAQGEVQAPAAVISDKRVPVPSHDPPQISVVIPVGPGHEDLVIDAIDSVDAQTYRHWECIVVNDSGRDLGYLPSWVRLIETSPVGGVGVAAARNLGIKSGKARLFLPLDADDILEPEALMEMHKVYRQYGGYVYSDWYAVHTGEQPLVWTAPDYDANQLVRNIEPTGPQTKDGRAGSLHLVTALTPRAAWQKVGGFDENIPAWEDWDFQLKLADAGICGTRVPLPLLMYRMDLGMRGRANNEEFQRGKLEGVKSTPQIAMESRWGEYFAGRKELMACRSCGGGGGAKIDPQTIALQQAARAGAMPLPDVQDYVVVEYIGGRMGAVSYRGKSGQAYRFSAAETEKQKYVRHDDAEMFQQRADFRVRQAQAPQEIVA